MWAKCRAIHSCQHSLHYSSVLSSTSTAQQTPIAIENADLWGHYTRPLKMIHSPDSEARRFGAAVVLVVIVSVGGNVESAQAIDGLEEVLF